jgi:hypothetical protein
MQPTLNAILKISKALGYKASTLVGLTQRNLDATSSDADARVS